MTNKEIANKFNLLGKLMELHGENQFKVRSYYSAYQALRRLDMPLIDMEEAEWGSIQGVGKAIQGKIGELMANGEMNTLNRYIEMTPPGVIDILAIKGLGPKKVGTIWKEMEIESPGELLYACNENRLIELKGFGEKTQADIIKQINFHLSTKGQFLYPTVESVAKEIEDLINEVEPDAKFGFVGEFGRKAPIVTDGLRIISDVELEDLILEELGEDITYDNDKMELHGVPLYCEQVEEESFHLELIKQTSSEPLSKLLDKASDTTDEISIFKTIGLPSIPAEIRDYPYTSIKELKDIATDLVEMEDIKGVIHNHTTYSDGLYSVSEMAEYTKELGYEYLVITDHSKSAFYANGLSIKRVEQQQKEIDQLNKNYTDFHVFKGIECDILYDGAMDYEDEVLAGFDLVIASVHSQLKMTEEKSNERLIKAIENPHVKMLGHMTGRLLLSRQGYPINHEKIIDACAENGVCIELNANPHRLDIDYKWIKYAVKKGVFISINPDAHNKEGIHDIRYGVLAARKGGLSKEDCLNTRDLSQFKEWLEA
jgi:DNA polymerase (family 10)